MSKFILDTSGRVAIHGRRAIPNPAEFVAWEHLDAFTQGYIEALFEAEGDDLCRAWTPPSNESEMDAAVGFADLAPDALARIIEDCRAWMAANDQTLGLAMGASHAGREHEAGRDFWFSRTAEGCHDGGFIDGDWPSPYRQTLEDASTAFGHVIAGLREDGKVYLS